jgi:3-deoxy-D-manno-octulosonic acid (KDO) 8-phosphate synthase
LNLTKPIFFIGGLAQMGGTALASGVLEKFHSISNLKNVGWVFAGTYSQKYPTDPKNGAGWGTLIEKNKLKSIQTISLPTVWTFHESEETPYIFTQSVSD